MGKNNTAEDFWNNVDVLGSDECWSYKLRNGSKGYRRVSFQGRAYLAHRLAYILEVGPVPEGLVVDHLCHTSECHLGDECPHRKCCNPAHLESKTSRENTERGCHINMGIRKREQTHCIRDHLFDQANTYINSNGTRRCLECERIREAGRPKRNHTRSVAVVAGSVVR